MDADVARGDETGITLGQGDVLGEGDAHHAEFRGKAVASSDADGAHADGDVVGLGHADAADRDGDVFRGGGADAALPDADRFGLDLGVRYEDVSWALDKVVQPRAVASLFFTDNITLKAGYRRLYQHSYSFLRNSCASFVFDQQYDDYKLFELGALGAKQADHYSISSEFKLAKNTRLSLEGYVKDYSLLPTWKTDVQDSVYDPGNLGFGYARGVEAVLEQSAAGGWSGWLTYALSWCRKQQPKQAAARPGPPRRSSMHRGCFS